MLTVSKESWNKISNDYKGKWQRLDTPEYLGKKTVLSGCISKEAGKLFIEDVHFVIAD